MRNNGEAPDEERLVLAQIDEMRAALLRPLRIVYGSLLADGRPTGEALRALAERAGVAEEDAQLVLAVGERLAPARSALEEVLDDPATSETLAAAARDLVAEITQVLDVVDALVARGGEG